MRKLSFILLCANLSVLSALAAGETNEPFRGFAVDFNLGRPGQDLKEGAAVEGANGARFVVAGNGLKYVPGPVGTALRFDGHSALTLKADPALNPGNEDFSVEYWVRFDRGDKGSFTIIKRHTGGPFLDMGTSRGGSGFWNAVGYEAFVGNKEDPEIANGLWHHVAMTFARAKMARIYHDAKLIQEVDIHEFEGRPLRNTMDIVIGAWLFNTNFFSGYLDEIRMVPGALTPGEIQKRYALGDPTAKATAQKITCRDPASLPGERWCFAEGHGNTTRSEAGREAVLQNVQWVRNGKNWALSFADPQARLTVKWDGDIAQSGLTVGCWVYGVTYADFGKIQADSVFLKKAGSFDLGFDPYKRLRLRMLAGGKETTTGSWLFTPYPQCHRWQMMAGAIGYGEMNSYVDGMRQQAREIPVKAFLNGTNEFVIGEGFRGILGRLTIFNDKLNREEIGELYRQDERCFAEPLLPVEALLVRGAAQAGKLNNFPVWIFNRSAANQAGPLDYVVEKVSDKQVDFSVYGKTNYPPRRVCAGTFGDLNVGSGQRVERTLQLPSLPYGEYRVTFTWNRMTALPRESFFYLVDLPETQPLSRDAQLKDLTLVATFEPDKSYPEGEYYEYGGTRVVKSEIGVYRESLAQKDLPRFGYRLKLAHPEKPHLLELEYPDDKTRTILVRDMQSNNLDIGLLTGGMDAPLTHKMLTLKAVFFPMRSNSAICVMGRHDLNAPPACGKIKVYEINEDLPRVAVNTPPDGGRDIGHHWEDFVTYLCLGGVFSEAEQRAGCLSSGLAGGAGSRYGKYLNYTGNNMFQLTQFWYHGPMCRMIAPEKPDAVTRQMSFSDWPLQLGLQGCKFSGSFCLISWPQLERQANYDLDKIRGGADTICQVSRSGHISNADSGRNLMAAHPVFNPLHPLVHRAIMDIFEEAETRTLNNKGYADSMVYFWPTTCLWFGSLKQGYEDVSIALFEKETGRRIPVDVKDPERFAKRYDWLMANARNAWIQWRCDKVTGLIAEISRITRQSDPDRTFTLMIPILPGEGGIRENIRATDLSILKGETSRDELLREGGFDIKAIGQLDGVALVSNADQTPNYRAGARSDGVIKANSYGRDLFLKDTAWRTLLKNVKKTTAIIGITYWENFDTAAPKGFWSTREYKNHCGGALLGGVHAMRPYARALGDGDPCRILAGGIGNPTAFSEQAIREFCKAFRALPKSKFDDVPGKTSPVAVRQYSSQGSTWFYLVNREFYPVEVTLTFDQPDARVYDGADATLLGPAGSNRSFKVDGYQLRSFRISGKGRLVAAQTVVAPADLKWLEAQIAAVEKELCALEAEKPDMEETKFFRQAVGDAQAAYQAGDWVAARDHITGNRVIVGRNTLIRIRALKSIDKKIFKSAPAGNIKVDGDLKEWGALPHTVPGSKTAGDLTAAWDLRHGKKTLFLAVEVRDNQHVQNKNDFGFYRQDSIQLNFSDPQSKAESSNFFDIKGNYVIDAWLMNSGVIMVRREVKEPSLTQVKMDAVQCVIVRDEDKKTTTYELAIPYAAIPPIGADSGEVGFNLQINDLDDGKPYTQYNLTPVDGSARDGAYMPLVRWAGAKQP